MKGFLIGLGILCLSMAGFSQQVAKRVLASNGEYVGFLEYKPTNYDPAKRYPLIIFLHGIGERGNGTTDINLVAQNAIPKYIKNGHTMTFTVNGITETFLVLSPQLDKKYGSWQNFYTEEMIKHAQQTLSIDPDRIYLTGLSLGGGGVWKYASSSSTNASKLAAIAPVCGTYDLGDACNITRNNLGVWAFHAKDDGVVGVGNTQGVQYAINQCVPNYPATWTYYQTGGHAIWDISYSTGNYYHTPNLYQWFLSIRKSNNALVAPIAKAGDDQFLQWPVGTVSLNGSSSFDSDGSISQYSWSQVSGPNTASIGQPSAAITTLSNLVPGTYTFRLRVVDNHNLQSIDDVVINISNTNANQAPKAVAGNDFSMNLPMDSLVLDAARSSDADGTIIGYKWSQLAGPVSSTMLTPNNRATWVKRMSTPGVYSFLLEVTDNQGAKAKDTVNITIVGNVNQGTVSVTVGANQTLTAPVSQANLSGTASTTSGSISSYNWSLVNGPSTVSFSSANTASTSVSQLIVGTYTFRLTATNSFGISNSATMSVTVQLAPVENPNNKAPIAVAGNDFDMNLPGDSLIVDAYKSYDVDGTLSAYKWRQISGPSQASILSPNARNTWIKKMSSLGVYSFELEVTDNQGAKGFDTLNLTMRANQSLGVVSITAGNDQVITLPTNQTNLNGWASSSVGTIRSYQWSLFSGPSTYAIQSPNAVSTLINQLGKGVYVFQLTAENSNGVSSSAKVQITVLESTANSTNKAPVAIAGNDFDMYLPNDSLIFSGWTSYDPDGSIVAYKWSQIGGPVAVNLLTPNEKSTWAKRMSVVGPYSFRLEVTDNQGLVSADTVVITMRSQNSSARILTNTFGEAPKGTVDEIPNTQKGVALSNHIPARSGVYPNLIQSSAILHYQPTGKGTIQVRILSSQGVMMKLISIPSSNQSLQQRIDFSNLTPGVYLVQVIESSTQQKPAVYRVVKQ